MATDALAGATIVFDLDGTLVDTAPDLVRALNAALASEGLGPAELTQVRAMVGRGARVLIERVAAARGLSFSSEKVEHLTRLFIEAYRLDIARESRPFAGVPEALTQLADAGAKLVVCTNKRTDLSIQLLDALSLTQRFAAIVGADAVANRKPDAEHYHAAVARAGGVLGASMMVGDSAADVGAARAAGAPCAVVSFGYSDIGAELLGADALFHHYSELTPLCRRLLAARP